MYKKKPLWNFICYTPLCFSVYLSYSLSEYMYILKFMTLIERGVIYHFLQNRYSKYTYIGIEKLNIKLYLAKGSV